MVPVNQIFEMVFELFLVHQVSVVVTPRPVPDWTLLFFNPA